MPRRRFVGFAFALVLHLSTVALLVWLSIIPLVPATVTLFERLRELSAIRPFIQARDQISKGAGRGNHM